MMFTEAWLRGPADIDFYTRTYTPPTESKAVLVFIHGFIEHIARYEHVFPTYSQAGIAVFAFDQRGFGRTALDYGLDGKLQQERERRKEGYGRTHSDQQKEDIFWAVKHAGKDLAHWGQNGKMLPVFLMGHSMGGALVLSFGANPPAPLPFRLAGIISTSPLVAQTHRVSSLVRKVGGAIGSLSPWTTVPAGVKAENLSHDKAVADAYLKDPLVQQFGTLKGVNSMLNLGDNLSSQEFKSWPVDLPLLLIHGSDDQVTSPAASEKFYLSISANDKHFSLYQGGFHELQNEPDLKQRLFDEVIAWILKHAGKEVSDIPEARL
ncbi:lysophospholipase [Ramaria rubella]|nr:lysophospholipase [Ramaria rubella]